MHILQYTPVVVDVVAAVAAVVEVVAVVDIAHIDDLDHSLEGILVAASVDAACIHWGIHHSGHFVAASSWLHCFLLLSRSITSPGNLRILHLPS